MKSRARKTKNKIKYSLRKNILASAISLCMPYSIQAANFDVTVSSDNGTGLITGTLSHAILQANTTPGDDSITLTTNVAMTGVMKRLIDSNITIQGGGSNYSINGDSQYRPIFIKSGNVIIKNLDLLFGKAQGGDSEKAGAGAGMGGSIFIHGGNVKLSNLNINASQAVAGQPQAGVSGTGGGGMFGYATGYAGGGLFGNGSNLDGGYGGYGNYQSPDPKFGSGGSYATPVTRHAGFGGGGAYYAGSGGFGGGGAAGDGSTNAGDGGFGGGAGTTLDYTNNGSPGYGASGQYSAGMGGAIFIRSGTVDIKNVAIFQASASSSGGAKGLGAGVFVLHTTTNTNGNNQGMPTTLASVSACGMIFANNNATGDVGASNNNDDIFDLGNRINISTGFPVTENCDNFLIFNNSFED